MRNFSAIFKQTNNNIINNNYNNISKGFAARSIRLDEQLIFKLRCTIGKAKFKITIHIYLHVSENFLRVQN